MFIKSFPIKNSESSKEKDNLLLFENTYYLTEDHSRDSDLFTMKIFEEI
jgi:hypothetical protein